jgi:single-strand DNA-binding protein
MNQWQGMGRLTKDLELRTSQSGMSLLSFTIAVNRKFSKEGEQKQADFISCKAFGKTAENIAKFFNKGNLIIILGHIQTGSYDNKEGAKVYTTDIMVDGFEFTGEKRTNPDQRETESFEITNIVVSDDELPF